MELLEKPDPIIEPNWVPLEEMIGARCAEYMYIAGYQLEDGTVVHAYKQIDTRKYVNLSDDGRSWQFTGDGYQEVREIPVERA
ncbi:hypothetical protein A2G06_16870 (plasmid) [Geobacter anodireducens]|nr:hypothetical protein A2G06_16870 [Geobacter anodireducens]